MAVHDRLQTFRMSDIKYQALSTAAAKRKAANSLLHTHRILEAPGGTSTAHIILWQKEKHEKYETVLVAPQGIAVLAGCTQNCIV